MRVRFKSNFLPWSCFGRGRHGDLHSYCVWPKFSLQFWGLDFKPFYCHITPDSSYWWGRHRVCSFESLFGWICPAPQFILFTRFYQFDFHNSIPNQCQTTCRAGLRIQMEYDGMICGEKSYHVIYLQSYWLWLNVTYIFEVEVSSWIPPMIMLLVRQTRDTQLFQPHRMELSCAPVHPVHTTVKDFVRGRM